MAGRHLSCVIRAMPAAGRRPRTARPSAPWTPRPSGRRPRLPWPRAPSTGGRKADSRRTPGSTFMASLPTPSADSRTRAPTPSARRSPPGWWSPTARWAPCSRPRTRRWRTSRTSRAATRSSTSPAPTSCAPSTRRTSRSASTASRPTPSARTTRRWPSTTSPSAVYELSEAGARIAREVADEFGARDGRQRWVLGSIGPGTKLPTLGHVPYRTLRDGLPGERRGPDRRRRRRADRRDHPGPAADQGRRPRRPPRHGGDRASTCR